MQSFSQKDNIVQRRVPKEAAFAEKNSVIVGGSNHGKVYVWNKITGALIQQLNHPDGGMVQAVTVSFKGFVDNRSQRKLGFRERWAILYSKCVIRGK